MTKAQTSTPGFASLTSRILIISKGVSSLFLHLCNWYEIITRSYTLRTQPDTRIQSSTLFYMDAVLELRLCSMANCFDCFCSCYYRFLCFLWQLSQLSDVFKHYPIRIRTSFLSVIAFTHVHMSGQCQWDLRMRTVRSRIIQANDKSLSLMVTELSFSITLQVATRMAVDGLATQWPLVSMVARASMTAISQICSGNFVVLQHICFFLLFPFPFFFDKQLSLRACWWSLNP